MTLKYIKNIALYTLIAMFFILDRYLKYVFNNSDDNVSLIGDILSLNFVPNEFVAFSIPLSGVILAIILPLLIISIIVYAIYAVKRKEHHYQLPFLVLILLGASSNAWDRIQFSYVIDYLDLRYFTVFNIADVMIFTGAIFLIFLQRKKTNQ